MLTLFLPFVSLFSFTFPVEGKQNLKKWREKKNLFNYNVKGSPNTKAGPTQDFQSKHDFTTGRSLQRFVGLGERVTSSLPIQPLTPSKVLFILLDFCEWKGWDRIYSNGSLVPDLGPGSRQAAPLSTWWLRAGRMLQVRHSSLADCSANILLFQICLHTKIWV